MSEQLPPPSEGQAPASIQEPPLRPIPATLSTGDDPLLNAKRIVRFFLRKKFNVDFLLRATESKQDAIDNLHNCAIVVNEDGKSILVRNADLPAAVDILFDRGIFWDILRIINATVHPARQPPRRANTLLMGAPTPDSPQRLSFRISAIDEDNMDAVLVKLGEFRKELECCCYTENNVQRFNTPSNAAAMIKELDSIVAFLKS